ncbi:NAD-dependent epimerase/dehydratase family protein [Kocuria sp. CPCC 205268]|uniref:NAD-dependent epimerase/dehydratase family protein n=1 Tax=Kocuria oxytropis TaxID=3058913 RepID=UPI0034D5CE56
MNGKHRQDGAHDEKVPAYDSSVTEGAPPAGTGSHEVERGREELTGTGRTVLVTGASGMLGEHVARRLRDRGWTVRLLQRRHAPLADEPGVEEVLGSVADPEAVARAVEGVDDVVHLAAKVSFAGDWADFVRTNVTGTRVVLESARAAGAGNVVFVSSPSVAHTGESIVGEPARTADPVHARGDYARSKAAAELLALEADGHGLRVTAVRPHIVWGPGDTQLVERIVDRAARGRLPLLDHGAALIDTTYVDNAAEAVVRALERIEWAHGQALVVTNGQPRTVGELVAGFCRAAGVEPPARRVPGAAARLAGRVIEKVWALRPGADEPPMTAFLAEQMSTAHWFEQRTTREVLDWTPSVTVEEGMERLAAHYRDRPRAAPGTPGHSAGAPATATSGARPS